jgi:hypothetical protein
MLREWILAVAMPLPTPTSHSRLNLAKLKPSQQDYRSLLTEAMHRRNEPLLRVPEDKIGKINNSSVLRGMILNCILKE